MAKVRSIEIVDKKTLRLSQDAYKGDTIHLDEIETVDLSFISEKISSQTDMLFNQRLQELRTQWTEEQNQKMQITLGKSEIEFKQKETEYQNQINQLKLEKSSLNVKKIGERLEIWCNEEYDAYRMAGAFHHCTWSKDNQVVQGSDGVGTKADYIFKVYSDTNFVDDNLLTSVCVEMKSEDPTSKNKTKNSKHFPELDQNRKKKNAEYALLVSELEFDSPNDSPIKMVDDQRYQKMYIVRPSYFITFLSLVSSLSYFYKELLQNHNVSIASFKDHNKIIEEFNRLRDNKLIKSIQITNSEFDSILKHAKEIEKKSKEIYRLIEEKINPRMNRLLTNIEGFEIEKLANKINKIA